MENLCFYCCHREPVFLLLSCGTCVFTVVMRNLFFTVFRGERESVNYKQFFIYSNVVSRCDRRLPLRGSRAMQRVAKFPYLLVPMIELTTNQEFICNLWILLYYNHKFIIPMCFAFKCVCRSPFSNVVFSISSCDVGCCLFAAIGLSNVYWRDYIRLTF